MGQTKWSQAKPPSHVRIYKRQMNSLAWLHLSGSAVKVLLTLAALERGENNGELFLSDRKGAELTGLSRNTVWRSLHELIDKGFIYVSVPGGFSRKTPHAACYGLTWAAGPRGTPWRAPSHAYEEWRPEGNTRSQILTETVPNSGHHVETPPLIGSDIGPDEPEKSLISVNRVRSDIGPHTSNQGIGAAEAETDQRKRADLISGAFPNDLRDRLKAHLDHAEPGEQSRLANVLGIPGGTLSKFVNGKSLPDRYAAALASALMREAA